MTNKNEQKFYSALKDVFVGEKVEGESGYVNLMKIKNEYFEKIKPFIENEINETISDDSAREELFEKLYTFFESYFSDTGTPFFDKTQLHKNLYEKVYTERDDVSLFWKTQKLYYVKSEANYTSMDLPDIDGFKFVFDASEILHKKSNEKKSLEFYLSNTEESELTFKVRYIDNTKSKWDRLKIYLDQNTPAKVRKHLAENLDEIDHGSINVISNSLDRSDLRPKFIEDNIIIKNNDDSIQSVDVEFAVSKLNNLETYFAKRNIIIDIATVKKAFTIYKKQNEVDYFIHKDAEGFLKEQFDIYLYNYLFGEGGLESDWQQERINDIQNIKKIAHTVIEYIAHFEDELKAIWEKPKFVRNSNYVFTLDRIKDNVELIETIINHEGFGKQVEEWEKLGIVNGDFSKDEIITNGNLSEPYFKLPIDTKYFTEINNDIFGCFEDIEQNLDGMLIKSDNFQSLNTTKQKFKSSVKMFYLDPPFNKESEANYEYKVKYKDSTWVTILENRFSNSNNYLTKDGVYFVRCDHNGSMYVRLLLNHLLGNNFFKNEIFVQRGRNEAGSPNKLETSKESLFLYSKKDDGIEKIKVKRSVADIKWTGFLMAGDRRPPERIFLGKELMPPKGQHFSLIQPKVNKLMEEKFLRLKCRSCGTLFYDAENNFELDRYMKKKENRFKFYDLNSDTIYFGLKKLEKCPSCENDNDFIVNYLGSDEKYVNDNWTDISGYSNTTGFLTENAESLLKRSIQVGSKKNEIVCDYFLGCGTTTAVAHKLGRKWIGVEVGDQFYEFVLPRMKKVLFGDSVGISRDSDVKWKGGGFFKYYELEQFEDALRLAKYNPKDADLANVNFQKDEKLLDAVEIDRENENVKIHFETLYPDVDIAETLSNLLGKKIKKLNKERVIFEDDMEIIFDEMTYEKYPWVKPLIWWKSK